MDRPRITLIKPPIPYHLNPSQQQPLGIIYVAAFLLEKGYDVKLVDLGCMKADNNLDLIPEAEIYGITATFLDLKEAEKIADILRQNKPNPIIAIGGPGSTASPEFINPEVFDSKIIGEGETSFLDLIEDYENKNKVKREYLSPPIHNLDELPFPARHLYKVRGGKIFSFGREYNGYGSETTGIITSRGCPYSCAFCASKALWKREIRFRSIDNVVSEIMEVVRKLKIRQFKIQDEVFCIRKDRVLELCDKILEKNMKIIWRAYGVRVDTIDEEMLKKMKEAGCVEIGYGIESGDQAVLDLVNKGTTVEQNIEAVKLAHKVGLETRAYMMVGLPGTTEETPERNIEFVKKARPEAVNIAIFTPYPGSDIWENPKKYNVEILFKPQNYKELNLFDKYNMHIFSNDPKRTTQSVISIDGLTPRKLEEGKQEFINYAFKKGIVHFG